MKKNMLLILAGLLLTACSQKSVEPKVEILKEPTKEVTHERTTTETKTPKEVIAPLRVEANSEIVPEHIRRSNIEVVPH